MEPDVDMLNNLDWAVEKYPLSATTADKGFYQSIWYENICAKNIIDDMIWELCLKKYHQWCDMIILKVKLSLMIWYDIFAGKYHQWYDIDMQFLMELLS